MRVTLFGYLFLAFNSMALLLSHVAKPHRTRLSSELSNHCRCPRLHCSCLLYAFYFIAQAKSVIGFQPLASPPMSCTFAPIISQPINTSLPELPQISLLNRDCLSFGHSKYLLRMLTEHLDPTSNSTPTCLMQSDVPLCYFPASEIRMLFHLSKIWAEKGMGTQSWPPQDLPFATSQVQLSSKISQNSLHSAPTSPSICLGLT